MKGNKNFNEFFNITYKNSYKLFLKFNTTQQQKIITYMF